MDNKRPHSHIMEIKNVRYKIYLHKNDLPHDFKRSDNIAIDTETTGLSMQRDRLCLIQFYNGEIDDGVHLVKIDKGQDKAPVIEEILKDAKSTKLFHYARFDMSMLYKTFGVMPEPVYCTKIASKLSRTYTERHGLKELCDEILKANLSKNQQSSDWSQEELTTQQKNYAACDVIYLQGLRKHLDKMVAREAREVLAHNCFNFLKTRVLLDLHGWGGDDIFAH